MIARRRTSAIALGLAALLGAPSFNSAAEAAKSDPDTIVLTFVGDVGLNSSNATVDPKGVQRYGFQSWRETTDRIADEINGDLNFMNVETVVTDRNDLHKDTKGQSGPFNFRTHPEGIAHLLVTGFNLYSLANNIEKCTFEWCQTNHIEKAKRLFGQKENEYVPAIMVRFDTSFANNYALIKSLLLNGMNVARINCAHDDEGMVGHD